MTAIAEAVAGGWGDRNRGNDGNDHASSDGTGWDDRSRGNEWAGWVDNSRRSDNSGWDDRNTNTWLNDRNTWQRGPSQPNRNSVAAGGEMETARTRWTANIAVTSDPRHGNPPPTLIHRTMPVPVRTCPVNELVNAPPHSVARAVTFDIPDDDAGAAGSAESTATHPIANCRINPLTGGPPQRQPPAPEGHHPSPQGQPTTAEAAAAAAESTGGSVAVSPQSRQTSIAVDVAGHMMPIFNLEYFRKFIEPGHTWGFTKSWRQHNIALKYVRDSSERTGVDRVIFHNSDATLIAEIVHDRGPGYTFNEQNKSKWGWQEMVAQLNDASMVQVVQGPDNRSRGIVECRIQETEDYDHKREVLRTRGERPVLKQWDFVLIRDDGSTASLHPNFSSTKISYKEGSNSAVAESSPEMEIPKSGVGGTSGPGTYKYFKFKGVDKLLRFDGGKRPPAEALQVLYMPGGMTPVLQVADTAANSSGEWEHVVDAVAGDTSAAVAEVDEVF